MDLSGGSRISQRRGHQLSRGGATYNFAKFSQKLHEIERIWAPRGEGASLAPPFDPPLDLKYKNQKIYLKTSPTGSSVTKSNLCSGIPPYVSRRDSHVSTLG